MMKEEFKPFDAAEYLETPEDMAGYLDACLEEDHGDGVLIRKLWATSRGLMACLRSHVILGWVERACTKR